MQGQASLNIPNHRGDTPLTMLQTHLGSVWIGSKVSERIKEEMGAYRSRTIMQRITKDKVTFKISSLIPKIEICSFSA